MFLFKKSRNLFKKSVSGVKWVTPTSEKKEVEATKPAQAPKAPRKAKAVQAAPEEKISTEE